jgi:hypothetical protein
MLRYTTTAFGMIALLIAVTVALPSAPAGAWTQPANTQESYWAPGPPPGSASPYAVHATTMNGIAYGSPYAQGYCLYGYGSICENELVYLYAYSAGNPISGFACAASFNTTCTAPGFAGWSVLTAYYYMWNVYDIEVSWEASWLG